MPSGIAPISRAEALRKSMAGTVPGHTGDHVGFSIVCLSQPQLWHLNWLLAVHSVRDHHSQMP